MFSTINSDLSDVLSSAISRLPLVPHLRELGVNGLWRRLLLLLLGDGFSVPICRRLIILTDGDSQRTGVSFSSRTKEALPPATVIRRSLSSASLETLILRAGETRAESSNCTLLAFLLSETLRCLRRARGEMGASLLSNR